MASFTKSERSGILYDEGNVSLSTLANKVALTIGSKIDGSRENGFRILRTDYWITGHDFTAGEYPITVGLSFGSLSVAEIAEAFAADPQSSDKRNLIEQTMRPIFILGILGDTGDMRFLTGTVKPRWSSPEGAAVKFFAYNSTGATLTTGASVRLIAKHFGVWLKD